MKYTDLPLEIRNAHEAIECIQNKYMSGYTLEWIISGAYLQDIPHGDKVRLGKLNAKIWRLAQQCEVSAATVYYLLANKDN